MSIRRSISAVALALAALLGLLVPVPPATADHANGQPGHWRTWENPRVTTPGCYNNWCDQIADAAYFWQDRGFYHGYVPPLPQHAVGDCGGYWGYINVCFVPWNHFGLWKDGAWKWGVTTTWYHDNYNHIGAARIYIRQDLSNYERQRVMRHEMGHALGLGHTQYTACVMHEPLNHPLGETCPHDIWSLEAMYNHWD